MLIFLCALSQYMDNRVVWIDERTAPFRKKDFADVGDMSRAGWLYQQALKWWTVRNLRGLCNDVVIMDSDVVWVRDIQLRVPAHQPSWTVASASAGINSGRTTAAQHAGAVDSSTHSTSYKLLYSLASKESGAFEGDIHTQVM